MEDKDQNLRLSSDAHTHVHIKKTKRQQAVFFGEEKGGRVGNQEFKEHYSRSRNAQYPEETFWVYQ